MAKVKLDQKDRDILMYLEKNGRALIKDISNKTGIPRDSVNYRIKRLLSEGVIKGFAPICDTNKLGLPIYNYVILQLQHYDEEVEKKFKSFLKSIPEVIYIAQITGAYHYIFTMATENIEAFDRTLRMILNKFPDIVKSYTTSLLVEEVQYDTFYRLIR